MNNKTYNTQDLETIIKKLETKISKTQAIKLIKIICDEGENGEQILLNLLIKRRTIEKQKISIVDSLIFEKLSQTKYVDITNKLQVHFSKGIIQLNDTLKLNYQILQDLLIQKKFEEADKVTQQYLCKLASLNYAKNRTWLYFTDIPLIPSEDLLKIDLLWTTYSQEVFGFSVQRNIWLKNQCKWTILWDKIGWTIHGIPCRYPNEFTWNLDAPKGHLPLFNQLRGIQVLSALFKHNAWKQIDDTCK